MSQHRPFYESRKDIYDCHIWLHPNFPPHLHKHLEFVYNAGGELAMTVAAREYQLHTGDCMLVYPNQIHSYSSSGEVHMLLIIANMDYINEFQEELTYHEMESPFFHRDQLSQFGQSIIDILLNRGKIEYPDVPYELDKGMLMVLLADIFRNIPMISRSKPTDLNISQKLLQYINANISCELSAAKTARALGISPYYLSHIFSEQLKISFPAYVTKQRLNLTCQLLKNTNKSITEITFETGFASMRTFQRCFKKEYGCTPMEYRKINSKISKSSKNTPKNS